METPSSTRRVTRSQALAALSSENSNMIPTSRKVEDSGKVLSKSRQRNAKQQQDRSVLIDITNDSPIVGVAAGSLGTPSSAIAKQRSGKAQTKMSGSGEALLRGQVKSLLQRVEEEAELSKLSIESRPLIHLLQGFTNSPTGLLAPTPANTPQVSNLSGNIDGGLPSAVPSPVVEEQSISQLVNSIFDGKKLDFSEKSESSDSSDLSVLSCEGGAGGEKSPAEDDDASVWSIQVNASICDEGEEEELAEEEEEEEDYYDEEEEEGDDGGLVDELCAAISNISVDEKRTAPKFAGKHTRFVYDSDDELVGAEEEGAEGGVSPSVLRLKGLPTPKGKHLRFPPQDEEGTDN